MSNHPFKSFTGNGHGNGATPSKIQHDGIPIIGQPFQIKGGFPTASLQCGCAGRDAVLLVGSSPGQCASCKRAFVIAKFVYDAQTGRIDVNIGLVQQQEQPTPEPAGVG